MSGPSRVGGKYPDSWHWIHLRNPREIEPRSNMPPYAFLLVEPLDLSLTQRKLEVLRALGHPYEESEIQNAVADARAQAARVAASLRKDGQALEDAEARSEAIALIAFLQRLGTDIRWRDASAGAGGAGR
jgi:cytochrome c oxidase cbb3-type subunit I/II